MAAGTKILTITQLNDVITCLEKNDFEEDQWKDLGLKLGIKPPKLNSIEANNPRNVKACLRECLTLWLRWNFDIEQLGKPTMESLAAAVDKMGLGDVASRILGKTNGATSQEQASTNTAAASGSSSGSSSSVAPTKSINVDEVKKELHKVLNENQVLLNDIFTETPETLAEIAREMNAVNIIGKAVREKPAYDAIINSFVNGMKLRSEISKVEEHCNKFLKALSNAGGPVADAGDMIKTDWIKAAKEKCGVDLKLQ